MSAIAEVRRISTIGSLPSGSLCPDRPVGAQAQPHQHTGEGCHEDQTADGGTCMEGLGGGDQGTHGVDQIAHGIAGAQLEADAAPQPFLLLK